MNKTLNKAKQLPVHAACCTVNVETSNMRNTRNNAEKNKAQIYNTIAKDSCTLRTHRTCFIFMLLGKPVL